MFLFGKGKRRGKSADFCRSLDNRKLQYVTERSPDGETVIGKSGYINVRDDLMIICCEGKDIFRSRVADTECSELMSLNGVIITGYDTDMCRTRTVVAYYLYYRK